MFLQYQSYVKDHLVEKMDCMGHVQKRMGMALEVHWRGQKLADGKMIDDVRQLRDKLINSLQNKMGTREMF